MLNPAVFSIDAFENHLFHGFTKGHAWNGFACPLFTQEEGLRLLEINNTSDFCGSLRFAPEQNAFLFQENESSGEPPVAYAGIEVEGQTLYPIGAYGWTWDTCADAEAQFSSDLRRELSEMKKTGLHVPDKAFGLVCDREWLSEQMHMRVSDAADLAIEQAKRCS